MAQSGKYWTRRQFLKASGVGSGALLLTGCDALFKTEVGPSPSPSPSPGGSTVAVIDQSGQLGNVKLDTVLAGVVGMSAFGSFETSNRFIIIISARVKQAAYMALRQRYRQLWHPYLKLHTAGVALLLRDMEAARGIERVFLDEEFPGKTGNIISVLNHRKLRLLDRLAIRNVRGTSEGQAAHLLASQVYRARMNRMLMPNNVNVHVVDESELISALGIG